MTLESIAMVKNDFKEIGKHNWGNVVSELIVRPDLADALIGLEEFSHIHVIFWMRLSPPGEQAPHKTHPQKRQDLPLVGVLAIRGPLRPNPLGLPLVGVLATRSPVRPNPLGLTAVKLLERRGNILKVIGLDAVNGTPVLDIKPYLPRDSVSTIKVPDWVDKLKYGHS